MSKWRARALELFPDMRTEVESADSVGALWIELTMRLQQHDDANDASQDDPNLFRSICLYATWCKGADSPKTQGVAAIEFYLGLPRFALRSREFVYKRFIQDLIANLPLEQIEEMGSSLQPGDLKRFLADVRQAEDERRHRSQKRSR